MTPEIRSRLERLRAALELEPALVVACDVGPPGSSGADLARFRPYVDLLEVCDGLRLGALVLWSRDDLPRQQFRSVDGDPDRLYIGQIDVDCLVLDGSGDVWLVVDEPYEQAGARRLGSLDEVCAMALDARYAQLVGGGDDDWTGAMRRLGFASAQSP